MARGGSQYNWLWHGIKSGGGKGAPRRLCCIVMVVGFGKETSFLSKEKDYIWYFQRVCVSQKVYLCIVEYKYIHTRTCKKIKNKERKKNTNPK